MRNDDVVACCCFCASLTTPPGHRFAGLSHSLGATWLPLCHYYKQYNSRFGPSPYKVKETRRNSRGIRFFLAGVLGSTDHLSALALNICFLFVGALGKNLKHAAYNSPASPSPPLPSSPPRTQPFLSRQHFVFLLTRKRGTHHHHHHLLPESTDNLVRSYAYNILFLALYKAYLPPVDCLYVWRAEYTRPLLHTFLTSIYTYTRTTRYYTAYEVRKPFVRVCGEGHRAGVSLKTRSFNFQPGQAWCFIFGARSSVYPSRVFTARCNAVAYRTSQSQPCPEQLPFLLLLPLLFLMFGSCRPR